MRALSRGSRTWFMLGLLLACVFYSEAQDQDRMPSKAERGAAQGRGKRIQQELKGPHNPEWAGVYFHGDGFHVGSILSLAPRSGFLFLCACYMIARDFNHGNLDLTHGTIKLLFTYPPYDRKSNDGIAGEFIPIRWGERHYLIGTDELLDFANSINAGIETESYLRGSYHFFLKLGDEEKAVSGEPSLPKEYLRYLLPHPITARISSVDTTHDNNDISDYDQTHDEHGYDLTTVTVGAGRTDGLLEGMTLYIKDPPLDDEAVVTRVSEHTAQVILHQHDYKNHRPSQGWTLSTRLLTD